MIKDDRIINSLIYGDAVTNIANNKGVELSEARHILSNMSFVEYCNLAEASTIVPPSGKTIAPSANAITPTSSTPGNQSDVKSIWPGQGAPVEVGMTVGLKGPNGLPVPGQISQVDLSAKGAKIKNPTTGQEEWTNFDMLEPFAASDDNQPGQQPTAEEASQLSRMRQLAGIRENSSCGATSAGAIAVAPAAVGTMKRRQPTDEQLKKEYTPKTAPKTIVGDTKPGQASGELSANLAVRGKKTASRSNNGFKR